MARGEVVRTAALFTTVDNTAFICLPPKIDAAAGRADHVHTALAPLR